MVMFICEMCGECLRKNAVLKHTYQCRGCRIVSCMDCNEHFDMEAYVSHTKCISEDQKYAGKNYVPRENKGEAKQDAWFDQVQRAIASVNPRNNALRAFLNRLLDYPNIPRKEAKFKNFVGNSLNCRDPNLLSEAWSVLSTAAKKPSNASACAKSVASDGNHASQSSEPPAKAVSTVNGKRRRTGEGEHSASAFESSEANGVLSDAVNDEPMTKKFKWTSAAKRILKDKTDQELKFSKLKKRVVAEYFDSAAQQSALSQEEAGALLLEKLSKNKKFIVEKDRVRLAC